MEHIQKIQHANRTVKVHLDPEPLNPRKEYDNGTVMVHWHTRYDLGDKQVERMTAEEMVTLCKEAGDPILHILPLYLYDHSGITISTGAFSCGWDSGQVGWVYITESKAEEMGWDKNLSVPRCEEIIKGEVKSYDAYLTGQMYGFVVEGRDGDQLESCWGFESEEDCLSEGKAAAERCEDPAVAREAEALQERVTYASVGGAL